jgi:hypothetical protein
MHGDGGVVELERGGHGGDSSRTGDRAARRTASVDSPPMVVFADYAFDVTVCLLIVFGGIGLLLNALIVYAVVQALGERKQNREAADSPQAIGPSQG